MLIKHDDTERVFDKHIHAPKIKKIYNASRHELLPEELGRLIPAWTVALNSKLTRVIYGPISTITDVVVGRS